MLKALLALSLVGLLSGCSEVEQLADDFSTDDQPVTAHNEDSNAQLSDIPEPGDLPVGQDYIIINDNTPDFSNEALQNTEPFTDFEPLDNLNRTGTATGYLTPELMPAEQRSDISDVEPTGWKQKKYSHISNNGWLYNRSHLIGYQLSGDDDNENLLTGTRQFNVDGMLPIENYVADYIERTGNPVLYRVTPHYKGDNLLSHGVQMEAYSPTDDGVVEFNVFVPNQQESTVIDYATGDSTALD